MKQLLCYLVLLICFAACRVQPQLVQQPAAGPANKFSDATLRTIHTLKDERNTPGLLSYLHDSRSAYRKEAALAFASVQDTLALPQLLSLLTDTTIAVREAAAFAIGQTGHQKAQTPLVQHLKQEKHPAVLAAMLEALGKIATAPGVDVLASYTATNDEVMAGQAWGLFRAGARQQTSVKAINKAVQLLADTAPYEARLAAAHFLARTSRIDLTSGRQAIITAATSDKSAEIRMALAQAIAKIRTTDKASILAGIAQSDPDYRVRINAIRAMAGTDDYKEMEKAILAGLTDSNINLAIATAEFVQANARIMQTARLEQVLPQVQNERVRAGIMWAVLRNSKDKGPLSNQYKQRYQNTQNPYDRAHLLKVLSADFNNYRFIEEEAFAARQPVVATSGMEALAAMRQQPDFPKALEQEFGHIFRRAIASGDVALVGVAAGVMREPKVNSRDAAYPSLDFLKAAQQKLMLPRDMETHLELQKTIDYLSGKQELVQPRPPYTHPIDWALVQKIRANQRATIRTEKGDIQIQLFVEDAPGTVANFVALAQQHFYDGLYFHRVVPNFVVQGGDKRGDGWGSSLYAIRSEFTPHYFRGGYLGMASAGKDTESNQWFITHSPTPHLDGRYSLFALVVTGMEVVHQLQVGDRILSVEVK